MEKGKIILLMNYINGLIKVKKEKNSNKVIIKKNQNQNQNWNKNTSNNNNKIKTSPSAMLKTFPNFALTKKNKNPLFSKIAFKSNNNRRNQQ